MKKGGAGAGPQTTDAGGLDADESNEGDSQRMLSKLNTYIRKLEMKLDEKAVKSEVTV